MSLQSPTPRDSAEPTEQHQGRPTGEQVPQEGQNGDVFLRLKNGEIANVRLALAEREALDFLLKKEPRHFEVLLAVCRGEPRHKAMSEREWNESIEFLKAKSRDIRPDGTVRPLTRQVLLSSYQITTDGPVLVQPFELTGQNEKLVADMIDRQVDERQMKLVRDMLSRLSRLDNDNDRSRRR